MRLLITPGFGVVVVIFVAIMLRTALRVAHDSIGATVGILTVMVVVAMLAAAMLMALAGLS